MIYQRYKNNILIREMERLKDPAMLLSVANSIGLVGTTAYFYKQLESIRLDMVKMSQTLTGILRKLTELEKGDQHKNEALHSLNDQIKRINDQIDDLPTFDNFDNMDLDLSELFAALEENNIPIERPSLIQRSRRSGDRRGSSRRQSVESDVDDRRDTSTRRNSARSNDRFSRDTSRDLDVRPRQNTNRNVSSRKEHNSDRQDTRNELLPNLYDDDADLIGEVRRQQNTRN